jgi:hypothetical protein
LGLLVQKGYWRKIAISLISRLGGFDRKGLVTKDDVGAFIYPQWQQSATYRERS